MPKPPVPRDRELRQLFLQLCDQAADVAASSRACRCSEDVESTRTDSLGEVNAVRRDLIGILQRVGAASVGDDVSDEVLKRTLARLESHVSALDGGTTIAIDGRAESTLKIGTPTSPREERTESPTNTEISVESSHGQPLTLMRLPPEIRTMIWWEALRPESGFVPLRPWGAFQWGYVDRGRIRARIVRWHRARTALNDRKARPSADPRSSDARGFDHSWEREGEHWGAPWTGVGWALLRVNKQVYEEAEAAYWRRAVADGLMFSFGCGRNTGDYWGLAVARTFFNDFTTLYLQNIQRVHLDLRRPDYDDGPNGYGGRRLWFGEQRFKL